MSGRRLQALVLWFKVLKHEAKLKMFKINGVEMSKIIRIKFFRY